MADESIDVGAKKSGSDVKSLLGSIARTANAFESAFDDLDGSLTVSQWAAIDVLVETDVVRPFQLAKKLNVSRQRAWQIMNKLKGAGLVSVSQPDPDTRAVEIAVTDAGMRLYEKCQKEIFDCVAEHLNTTKPQLRFGGARAATRALSEAFDAIHRRAAGA
mgnify:CR=1 FL=1